MQIIKYPNRNTWSEILARPALDTKNLEQTVADILSNVRADGDKALKRYAKIFDASEISDFTVTDEEFEEAEKQISPKLKKALSIAKANIEEFHRAQIEEVKIIETMSGVSCWRKSVAIEKVGLYVPAGTAPLFSTVLMLTVPARLAGCREIVICSPPQENGKVDSATLYAAKICGATKVYKVGGAQAIAAMTFGTESVPRCDKIFGPGNQFVTEAKRQASRFGVGADLPAGPSEVAVLADETGVPAFVAADLLAQAEHGADSQVLLVTTNEKVITETLGEIENQIKCLPRGAIARRALENSKAILVQNNRKAVEILNEYAAEHLILAVRNADEIADQITNAGSIFIGNYSCESAGDYATGTNHTLPTGGAARFTGGVSLDSFVKKITYQKLTAEGIKNLGQTVECLAEAEGLDAHKNAVTIRLENLPSGEKNEF